MPIRLFPRQKSTEADLPRGARAATKRPLAAALALLLAAAGAAQAQAASPCVALQADIEKTGNPLERMQAALPTCGKDPMFLAGLGALLNQRLRYTEAQEYLELALMLEPGLLGAQLNYAIALAGSGDLASAEAMLDTVLANPEVSPSLRKAVARQKASLSSTYAPSEWQSRLTLGLRLGFDSNLLGSPNLGSLTLTSGGQTQIVLLDESYLSKPGGYVRADAQLDVRRQDGDGTRWDLLASMRSRYSPVDSAAGSTQVDLAIERSHFTVVPGDRAAKGPASTQGSYMGLSVSELAAQAGTRYSALGVTAGWGRNWGGNILNSANGATAGKAANCQARGGLEFQERNYLNNQLLSGRYTGFSASMSCAEAGGVVWLAGLKAGRDLAKDSLRPGGDQVQVNLRLAATVAVADLFSQPAEWLGPLLRGSLLADADLGHYSDSNPYSAFIESGRLRITSSGAARMEYQYPLAKSIQWATGAEWVAQRSTLELFRQHGWGGYTALRATW